jgi:hypothetical protein
MKKMCDSATYQVEKLDMPKDKVALLSRTNKAAQMIGWVIITAIGMWLIREIRE